MSGSFSLTSSELYKKGLKAFYKLKGIFGTTSPNTNIALLIFDHTIKPILIYGSEIWGSCMKNSRRLTQTLDKIYRDFHAEKLHLKYCKYILGVHKKILIWPPLESWVGFLFTMIFVNVFLSFICTYKERNQTLQTSKQLHNHGYKSWYSGVDTILNAVKLDEFNICLIKTSLKNLYRNIWSRKINKEAVIKQGKLRTFALFKSFFQKRSLPRNS